MKLTWARSGFAFTLRCKTWCWSTQEAPRVEYAAAVVVGCWERIGRVGWDGMVSWRSLGTHGCQAAPERTTSLHFHTICQRHLVLDGFLLVHSRCCGGWWRRTWVRGHVLRWRWRETVKVVWTGVGRWGERWDWSSAGTAAAGVTGASRVQSGFAEVTDRPCVMMMSSRESCLAAVQPRNARTVD